MEQEKIIWGIHAGSGGESDSLFLNKNVIAIGWNRLENLSELPPNRESFKSKLETEYPETKPGAIPIHGGVLFRFVHEIQDGDLVVYPSKVDKKVHIGIVESDYQFSPTTSKNFPHMRKVKWVKSSARSTFTQGALYEIGSAVTLFLVKNYAYEFLAVFEGIAIPEVSPQEDETIAYVVKDIVQNSRDYVLKRLSKQLKGHPFAQFVGNLLEQMGYRTRVSKEGPDGGVDIVAHKDELGFEPPIVKVQVKSTDGNLGEPEVSALYGKVDSGEFGLFVTLGNFTRQAKAFSSSKRNLRLIDGDELVDLIFEHYETLDSKYKGLLQLRQVYIPEILQEDD